MKKNNERRLFFDIETTGLSPEVSAITLIGCLDDHGLIKQWFNEDGFSQKQILTDFLLTAILMILSSVLMELLLTCLF